MHVSDLDTPALLIDLDRMDANLRRAADYCAQHELRLRPHAKTHKNPIIGRLQLKLGAAGLTVAKVGEAEVMLSSGSPDLLVAYPVIGEGKLRRLMDVALQTKVTVAVDSTEAAEGLSRAASEAGVKIGVLVEADLGMKRCGLQPGEELVALARHVARQRGLRLEGVAFYPGFFWPNQPGAPEKLRKLSGDVQRIREDFATAGLEINVMSGGSSPTLYHSHHIDGLNEVRPGTYVFNDVTQVTAGVCSWEDCAVTILTTVVSTPRQGFSLIDGGSKTFTSDAVPGSAGGAFGRVVEAPEAEFFKMNEEHGYVNTERAGRPIKIGDRLRIIPNHVCVAVNMHERVYGIRGDAVEDVWAVEARGKLQ